MKREKNKKYCMDCKFDGGEYYNGCSPLVIGKYYIETLGLKLKKELNKDGDCKYYKRKWFKFWVIN